jgi:hypothetical protein
MLEEKPKQAKIIFTKNGTPLPPPIPAPPGANDLHAIFDPMSGEFVEVRWTMNGDFIGDPIPIPEGANDLGFGLNGIDPLPPPKYAPPGTNDFEIFWNEEGITEAWWTRDGVRVEPVRLSSGAQSIHFSVEALAEA